MGGRQRPAPWLEGAAPGTPGPPLRGRGMVLRAEGPGHAQNLCESSRSPQPRFTRSAGDRLPQAPLSFLCRETEGCLDPEVHRGLLGSPGSRSVAEHLGGPCGSGAQAPVGPWTLLSPSSPCGATWILVSSGSGTGAQGSPCTLRPCWALRSPALGPGSTVERQAAGSVPWGRAGRGPAPPPCQLPLSLTSGISGRPW